MLSVLKIKNLALVDDLTWELGPGLIGVTGGTGAGKSMIVGALKLILGERANHDLIRTGKSNCTVEAVFELSSNLPVVNQMLEESGLDPCEGNALVVKRVFGGASGNKQFVNCSPCTLAALKSLGGFLVDLHGPHEHQSLLSPERQLSMLDAYAKARAERDAYAEAYRVWQKTNDDLEEFRNLRQATDQEIELLRYQAEEIENADLDVALIADLEKRYQLVSNSAKLSEYADEATGKLAEAGSAMTEAQRALRDLEKIDPKIESMTSGFESARVEIEELESALLDYTGELEFDPTEVVEMETRIDQIEGLKRKYGQTIEDVITYGERANKRLSEVGSREEELEKLVAEIEKARKKVDTSGAKLTKKRRAAAPKLAKDIAGHLKDLGFKQSVFEIELFELAEPGFRGFEATEFMFGPNPGEPLKPLRIIASSGEMSRVMLAVKSALADQDQIPLMVFDEIDANVGGEIAGAVGRKMAALGEQHQVVAITHMPQVASLAHRHYLVTKEFEGDSTSSGLEQVKGKKRLAELARMLGGKNEQTLALAETMLAGV
ncbi:MAG: DNA repair protein RecN [Verrucomicrobiales bacterium]|nr:DNA repair protein RecN [Verrucomicrobiales bacterium]